MSEPSPPDAPTTRRGRPRPDETVQRDEAVFGQVQAAGAEGVTRDKVAADIGLQPNQVYLSFFRLKRDGRIVRSSGTGRAIWTVAPEQPAA